MGNKIYKWKTSVFIEFSMHCIQGFFNCWLFTKMRFWKELKSKVLYRTNANIYYRNYGTCWFEGVWIKYSGKPYGTICEFRAVWHSKVMTAERREYGRGGHGRDMPGPPPDYFGGPPPPEHYYPPPHAPYEEPNWGTIIFYIFWLIFISWRAFFSLAYICDITFLHYIEIPEYIV